jgi:hypothetical protein
MPAGKLEKMLILAFETSEAAESGGLKEAKASYEALINPETYTLEYKVKTDDKQGQGTSGKQSKFTYSPPNELTFEFLFDNTGIIDGKPKKAGVFDEVKRFQSLLMKFQGKSHEPNHLKLVWGNLIFKGRAIELGITYKLFNPDGQPIRAVAKVKFQGSIEEKKRVVKEDRQSPDLTQRLKVKAGENLPLLCYRIYGDPKYYLEVAKVNDLGNFRSLKPGTLLIFPPIAKTSAES